MTQVQQRRPEAAREVELVLTEEELVQLIDAARLGLRFVGEPEDRLCAATALCVLEQRLQEVTSDGP